MSGDRACIVPLTAQPCNLLHPVQGVFFLRHTPVRFGPQKLMRNKNKNKHPYVPCVDILRKSCAVYRSLVSYLRRLATAVQARIFHNPFPLPARVTEFIVGKVPAVHHSTSRTLVRRAIECLVAMLRHPQHTNILMAPRRTPTSGRAPHATKLKPRDTVLPDTRQLQDLEAPFVSPVPCTD